MIGYNSRRFYDPARAQERVGPAINPIQREYGGPGGKSALPRERGHDALQLSGLQPESHPVVEVTHHKRWQLASSREIAEYFSLFPPFAQAQAQVGRNDTKSAETCLDRRCDGSARFAPGHRDVVDLASNEGPAAKQKLTVVAVGSADRGGGNAVKPELLAEVIKGRDRGLQPTTVDLLQSDDVGADTHKAVEGARIIADPIQPHASVKVPGKDTQAGCPHHVALRFDRFTQCCSASTEASQSSSEPTTATKDSKVGSLTTR